MKRMQTWRWMPAALLLIVNRNVGLVAFGVWLLVITFQYGEATATVKTIASTALSASNFNFFQLGVS